MSYEIYKATFLNLANPLLAVEFRALEEVIDYHEHFEDYGQREWVREQVKKGNPAAWFTAKVYVRVVGTEVISAPQILGCCSYANFDEFIKDQYFKEMIEEATKNLMNNLDYEIQLTASTLKMLNNLKEGKK